MKKDLLKAPLFALFAFFAMAMGMTTTSCSSSDDDSNDNTVTPTDQAQDWSKQKAKYTIMLYGCGGGDVDYQLEDAIPGIITELSVPNNQVRYTVMYSMSKDNSNYLKSGRPYSHYRGDWATTYRYELTPQLDQTKEGYRSKYKYKNASEVELYDPNTIAEYIKWATQTAPAENYIFMPINHGGGFDIQAEALTRGIIYDDNHLNKYNRPTGTAVSSIAKGLNQSGVHMKAIYWVGCLMGQLEVLTEVAPYCDYQFCSSHVSRAIDYLAYSIINGLNKSPNDFEGACKSNYEWFTSKEHSYASIFQNIPDDTDATVLHNENCDWGCWRSAKIAAVNEQVKRLATLLADNYATYKEDIDIATRSTYSFEYDDFCLDVYDYALQIADKLQETPLAAEAQDIAVKLLQALADANVYRVNGVNLTSANNVYVTTTQGTFTLGVSMYAAGDDKYGNNDAYYQYFGEAYKASAFDAATGWSRFIDQNAINIFHASNPCNNSSWELQWLALPEEEPQYQQ